MRAHSKRFYRAVLADGQFPGPLITGKKVQAFFNAYQFLSLCPQGDNFKINVVNKLTNETMLTDTTVVSEYCSSARTHLN